MYDALNFLDFLVFFLIMMITVGAVMYFRIKHPVNSTIEYMIMSRQLTLPLFIATLVATWYGKIIPVTSIAYKHGIYNFVTQGLFWYIGYVFFALVIVPKVSKYKCLSYAEMIGQIADKTTMRTVAIVMFFKVLPVTYAISMGVFLSTLFNINITLAMLLGIGFIFCYSAFTGFRGIVISDFVQFLVMFAAVISVVVVSIYSYGGMNFLFETLPAEYFRPQGNQSNQTMFIWLFLGISTVITSPMFYQRCFACEDYKTAKYGILLSVLFWVIFDLCTTLGGMYAYAVMPGLDSTSAYLIYAMEILPNGLKGLFLAGILATICSTFDSFIFINKSIISYDLFREVRISKRVLHMISLFTSYGVAILVALAFDSDFESIWLFVKGYSFAAIMTPLVLIQLFKITVSGRVFILTIILTIAVMLLNDWLKFADVKSFYIGCCASAIIITFALFSQTLLLRRVAKT